MLENMNKKRWIAVGVAILILGLSAISSSISSKFNRQAQLEQFQKRLEENFSSTNFTETTLAGSNKKERIVVLPIEGTIQDVDTTGFNALPYNHQAFLSMFDQIEQDDTIKGVLLYVNSPGGGVYESAEIRDKILKLKNNTDLPIWTYMANVAASGGYYVSAPTDHIMASPETITGSIGVIMGHTDMSGLMEKLGVRDDSIVSGGNKQIGSTTKPMTEEQRAILQSLIDNSYNRFVKVVAEGRKMDEAKVRELADGCIYDGEQALANGLVDELAFYEDALQIYADKLGLDDPEFFQYTSSDLSFFNGLFPFGVQKSEWSAIGSLIAQLVDTGPQPMYLYGGE